MYRELFRPEPKLPVTAMQTHQIDAPLTSHWRKATCEEVECTKYLQGYGIPLKGLDAEDLGLLRKFVEQYRIRCSRVEINDGEWHLWVEPGQRCLLADTHRKRLDREEIFLVRPGDWRGNPGDREPIVFSGADPFADHLHTSLDNIRE